MKLFTCALSAALLTALAAAESNATAADAAAAASSCGPRDASADVDAVISDLDAQAEGTVGFVENMRTDQAALVEDWFRLAMTGDLETSVITDNTDYISATVGWIAPGVIGLIFIAIIPCCCLGRCTCPRLCGCVPCCGCFPCCKPGPRKEQSPAGCLCANCCYFLFAILAASFCIAGAVAFGNIGNGLLTTGCALEDLADDSYAFVDGINDPMQAIAAQALDIIEQTETVIGTLSDLSNDLQYVIGNTTDYVNWAKTEGTIEINGETFSPLDAYDVDSIVSAMNTDGQEAVNTMTATQAKVISSLTEPKDTINELSSSASEATDTTKGAIDDFRSNFVYTEVSVADFPPQVKQVFFAQDKYATFNELLSDAKRNIVKFGGLFFSFIGIGLFFTTLGAVLMNLSWCTLPGKWLSRVAGCSCLTIGIIICFCVSTVFMVIGIAGSDVCVLVERVPDNTQAFFSNSTMFPYNPNSTDPISILDACFDDTNLLEALNLTGIFDPLVGDDGLTASFTTLDFNVTESFNFDKPGSDFANFLDFVEGATLDQFGWTADTDAMLLAVRTTCDTCTAFEAALDATVDSPSNEQRAGAVACDSYAGTEATVCEDTTANPLTGDEIYAGCRTSRDGFCTAETTLEYTYSNITYLLGELQSRLSGPQDAITNLQANGKTFQTSLLEVADNVDPILVNVDVLMNNTRCGFIGSIYADVDYGMCTQFLAGVLNTGMCMWFACYFAIVAMIGVLGQEVTLAGVGSDGDEDGTPGVNVEPQLELPQLEDDGKERPAV